MKLYTQEWWLKDRLVSKGMTIEEAAADHKKQTGKDVAPKTIWQYAQKAGIRMNKSNRRK